MGHPLCCWVPIHRTRVFEGNERRASNKVDAGAPITTATMVCCHLTDWLSKTGPVRVSLSVTVCMLHPSDGTKLRSHIYNADGGSATRSLRLRAPVAREQNMSACLGTTEDPVQNRM